MKKWRRVPVIILAAVMALGLCACGKKRGVSSDPTLAKQYVYKLVEYDLSSVQGQNDDSYVISCMEVDGRVYLLMQSYNYQNGNEYRRSLVSMDADGGNMEVYELQTAPEGEADRDEGTDREDSDATPDDGVTGDDAIDDIEDGEVEDEGFWEYTGFGSFQISDSGLLYGMKNYNFEDYTDPENNVQKEYICCWDTKGTMLWQTPVEGLRSEETWSYVNGVIPLQGGSMALMITGDRAGLMKVDAQGSLSDVEPLKDDLSGVIDRLSSWTALGDGEVFLTYYTENWDDIRAVIYDMNTGTIGTEIELPGSIRYNLDSGMTVDQSGDILYTTSQGVSKYHIGDEEPVQMMNYINSDLELNGLNTLLPIDEEHFIGTYVEYDEETYHSRVRGGMFTKVDPKDIPDKEVLVLAGNYIPGDLRKRAVEFNKTSDAYRIVLRDYSEYMTNEDYYAGTTRLNNDIISGNMPDIIVVEQYGNMTLDNYISKGLLADIGKLMEKDEEISKTEYMDNIFEACKVGGKLYEIIPSFSVSTYIGKTSLVGEREAGWTMEEAQSLLAGMPEGTKLFGDMSQTGFINVVMNQCGRDYVDAGSGKCRFDSPEFISLLEYAKTLPTDEELNGDRDDNWDAWYREYESQYRENRTLLGSCYIGDISNMVYTINGMFGEDVSYVGFPGSSGLGAVVYTNTTYALSARSANLDAAWEFMRYYLIDEYQDTLSWQLAVNKAKFYENAQKATQKPYYEDENGEKIEYDYTNWINDEEVILDPLTQEQVDRLTGFISTVSKRTYWNQDVMNIITEEIDAFLKGQKSAAEVAGIIQSRAQIYVNENR